MEEKLKKQLENDYKELHKRAEVGFELEKTVEYVKKRLEQIGVSYREIGKNGILGQIGKGEPCILLRADMDALPIKEEAELEYASQNGNMHACGHDAHTSMLLAAATALKARESELVGSVKLLFQPAEEILEGAKSMIKGGALQYPRPKAAFMLHVVVGTELETGSVIVSSGGVSAPSADYFRITVKGSGAHGSTPEKARDPLAVACRISLALEEIKAKELAMNERAVISVGRIISGTAANVIPDTAVIEGSQRCFAENTRKYIWERIKAISGAYGKAFGVEVSVDFYNGTPSLLNDEKLSVFAYACAKRILGQNMAYTSAQLEREAQKRGERSIGAGSEDFAYISREVPSVMIALAAGKGSDGYTYPLHHPRFTLDTNALPSGARLLSEIAFLYNTQTRRQILV